MLNTNGGSPGGSIEVSNPHMRGPRWRYSGYDRGSSTKLEPPVVGNESPPI